MSLFRVNYTIEMRRSNQEDFEKIGFGSSTDEKFLEDAIWMAYSDLRNYNWETVEGMPTPEEIKGLIEGDEG